MTKIYRIHRIRQIHRTSPDTEEEEHPYGARYIYPGDAGYPAMEGDSIGTWNYGDAIIVPSDVILPGEEGYPGYDDMFDKRIVYGVHPYYPKSLYNTEYYNPNTGGTEMDIPGLVEGNPYFPAPILFYP